MRRMLATLLMVPVLVLAVAAPAAAKAPKDWTYVRWDPQPIGAGWQCGVPFESMTPTGHVDFWYAPPEGLVQTSIQHWDGTMTFTGAGGSTVTLRENDWRHVTDTYYADGTGYTEVTRYEGMLEELRASDSHARLADTGNVTIKTENVFLDPSHFWIGYTSVQVSSAHGHMPMRGSGYDFADQGWVKECAFFGAHLT